MSEFTYQKELVIFRGAPVKKDTLYKKDYFWVMRRLNLFAKLKASLVDHFLSAVVVSVAVK